MNNLVKFSESDLAIIDQMTHHDWSVPEFKAKYFIANSHIHPLHKVKQLLLELGTRMENLELFEMDIKKFQIEIELENEKKNSAQFNAEKKLHELEALTIQKKLAIAEQKLKSARAEVDKFLRLINEFNSSEEGKDDNGTLYMEILKDPAECERIEAKYWEYRLAKQAALDMIAYGRIGVGNMEAIMQLDGNSQNKCIAMAYEILISNEARMNEISSSVVSLLEKGKSVSDVNTLLQIRRTDFTNQLIYQTQKEIIPNVPLIQKC